jgi:hypothetical protein
MAEKLFPLDFPPGLVNNGTPSAARNRWHIGNCVRFFEGRIQPIGGWVQRTTTGATIPAVPSAAISFTKASGTNVIVVGAGNGAYTVTGTTVASITPASLSGAADATVYWQFEMFGSYVIGSYIGLLIYWDPASVDPVKFSSSGVYGTIPTNNGVAMLTTPERFLVVLSREQDVYWASQESLTDWTPSSTNTAGDFRLETQGKLKAGKAARGQTLLWTTVDLWTMTYIGGDLIYSFQKAGDNCGIVSTLGGVVVDTMALWMGQGAFFAYDGFVRKIPCEVSDYVFGSMNLAYAFKIWALANPRFSEVTWFYPSASAVEVDRYVTYNYQEHHWSVGTLARSAGVSQQAGAASPVPVLFDATGAVYDHETGNARTGQTVYLESGPMQMGEGDNVVRIQRVIPDDLTAGDVTASLYTSLYPNSTETLNGPYTLDSPTSVRLTAREVRLRLTEAVASAWRVGTVRLGAILGGLR